MNKPIIYSDSNDNKSSNIALTPQEGANLVDEHFQTWSAGLAKYSLQASYAIIAANWAIHKKADLILSNTYAILSIALCVFHISVNILLTGIMSELLRIRLKKAERNPRWWADECRKQAVAPWPFTYPIKYLGIIIRVLRIASPILSGLLFLFSIYYVF